MTQTAVSALQIKKQGLEALAITDRGDRIGTCDLVLPKQPCKNRGYLNVLEDGGALIFDR